MEYNYTPSQEATSIVSLIDVKDELRIINSAQDRKITRQLKSCVEFFEEETGFLLRDGALKLTFSYKDSVGYDRRQEDSFARTYDDRYAYVDGQDSNPVRFYPELSANMETQRPTAFSFIDSNNNQQSLDASELAMLPEDFFLVLSKETLIFKLNVSPDYPDVLREKNFSQFSTNPISITLSISKPNPLKADIEHTIIRMIAMLFENPDMNQNFFSDSFCQQAFARYNSRTGL